MANPRRTPTLHHRARDRMVLDHDVLPHLGKAQLGEITHEVIQDWVNRLGERLAPSSVQRSFTILRQVLDFAVDVRAVSVNPSDRTRLPRRQRFEARFLTADELEHLASTVDRRSRAMVLVMAWATLRIGEAMGLRRSDVDLIAGGCELPTISWRSPASCTRDRRRRRLADDR